MGDAKACTQLWVTSANLSGGAGSAADHDAARLAVGAAGERVVVAIATKLPATEAGRMLCGVGAAGAIGTSGCSSISIIVT